MASPIDRAGRAVAGLLGYNPGPGIYSRLERAVQGMPANVRVEEIPGLLKRYRDGVPGWELKAADLDSVVAGRSVVPREELLSAVRERSPVYTHREVVLGGTPQRTYSSRPPGDAFQYERQAEPSKLGEGVSHSLHQYSDYSQGGDDYTEILLTQPGVDGNAFGSHWVTGAKGRAKEAVAHARFDTHGDALRINELQSDLGIHNRKQREVQGDYLRSAGFPPPSGWLPELQTLPFPLEDAWSDLLIKRLALEAARQGHRAIEIASPRAIADKVGGNIENYEHFYGKVVPGAIERLGRKMGGLTPDNVGTVPEVRPNARADMPQYDTHQELRDQFKAATGDDQPGPNFWRLYSGMRYDSLTPAERAFTYDRFGGSHPVAQAEGGLPQEMYEYLHSLGLPPEHAQRITSHAMYLAPHNARSMHNFAVQEQLPDVGRLLRQNVGEVGRRYLMSDEMRRRILTQGIGASLLAPMAMEE